MGSYKDKANRSFRYKIQFRSCLSKKESRVSTIIEEDPIDSLWDDQVDGEEDNGSRFQVVVNENKHDLTEEKDKDKPSEEEEDNEETTSEEDEQAESSNKEKDIFYSHDSQDHYLTQEKDEDEDDED
ncbi:prothymosin alpha-like [Capsicum annuum]